MTDEYTPTTMKVKQHYVVSRMTDAELLDEPIMPTQRFHDEFSRWLEAHDAEVRAAEREEAWDEGFTVGLSDGKLPGWSENPYRRKRRD